MRIWITVLCILSLATAAVATEQSVEKAPKRGKLTGRVLMDGKPIPGNAIVSLFDASTEQAPDQGKVRQVPKILTKVNKSGNFQISFAPGIYYLGAVARRDQRRKGPPGPDEKFFFARDNKGKLRIFKIVAGQTTKAGVLSSSKPESFSKIVNALTINGAIYDEQGKPFSGARIVVRGGKKEPRPLFISERTGVDGRYQLKLPPGGPYYLVARENLVNIGRPVPGNSLGTYGGSRPRASETPSIMAGSKPVSGGGNQVISNINITMYKMPDPEEIKRKILEESEKSTSPGNVVPQSPVP